MGKKSRTKGAAFERTVARELFAETGVTFRRNLTQYQESDHGDLTPDTPDWPFLIECKHFASGTDCRDGWVAQAFRAAEGTGLHPVVIYKFDFAPIRCRVWFDAMAEAFGVQSVCNQHADLSIQGFAWTAREIMAGRKFKTVVHIDSINT